MLLAFQGYAVVNTPTPEAVVALFGRSFTSVPVYKRCQRFMDRSQSSMTSTCRKPGRLHLAKVAT